MHCLSLSLFVCSTINFHLTAHNTTSHIFKVIGEGWRYVWYAYKHAYMSGRKKVGDTP